MNHFADYKEDLREALRALRDGGIILYPTDTIWGIGCDAGNEEAVQRIFQLKKREDSKSMLMLIDHEGRLESYVDIVPEIAWQLIDVADNPLTIIYPGVKNIAPTLIAKDGSAGFRITKEPFNQELIKALKKPLVSTSANISGEPSPQNFDEISEGIREGVDYVVQYRQDDITRYKPSSIIKLGTGGEIKILRK